MTFFWGWTAPVADPGNRPGRRARCVEWLPTPIREKALAGEPLPLRVSSNSEPGGEALVTEIGQGSPTANPSLHLGLQDLGRQIVWDLHQACAAFDDPNLWFPGIDEGIEPVSDDHVRLVIWAMQRELDRETRPSRNGVKRPAAPLAELPWRIQRAVVERRRYWYNLYGIGREQWLNNRWTLDGVAEDPDWLPDWLKEEAQVYR